MNRIARLVAAAFLVSSPVAAQTVDTIQVEGNRRVERDAPLLKDGRVAAEAAVHGAQDCRGRGGT